MDPFNNSVASVEHDFDTYYDEYYELYDIKKEEFECSVPEFNLFNPKKYFTKNKTITKI
jgi:hypothetical protein